MEHGLQIAKKDEGEQDDKSLLPQMAVHLHWTVQHEWLVRAHSADIVAALVVERVVVDQNIWNLTHLRLECARASRRPQSQDIL